MHDQSLLDLNWQPVLLVKISERLSSIQASYELYINRVYLALHPDGVVCTRWNVLPSERTFPQVHLVGWKPSSDMPFELPVCFQRKGDPRISATIPNGTWVLPYDHNTFRLLEQAQITLQEAIGGIYSILSSVVPKQPDK